MPDNLLIITPSSSLGETIRRELDETSHYRCHIVNNKASAVVHADEVGTSLALLDITLGEDWVVEIGQALRTVQPGIKLVLLCDESGTPPAFDSLRPWTLIHKPFRMSGFMTAISQSQQQNALPEPLSWLDDQTKAAQHLTRLTLESSAQAALITLSNDLWAYAGGLSQSAAKEVAQTVSRNWDGEKGSDLLRFIRLESTKAEHTLYATRLTGESVLAFVFEAETPFSTIRSQASHLLSEFNTEKFEKPKPSAKAPSIKQMEHSNKTDEAEELAKGPVSNILNDLPDPNPGKVTGDLHPKEAVDPNQTHISASLSNASIFFNREEEGIPVRHQLQTPTHEVDSPREVGAVRASEPSQAPSRPVTPVARPLRETDVTRESPSTEAARKLTLEPISAGMYHLTYTCMFVPRFATHYLTGDIADHLGKWLPHICIAFGWRLEYLSVRPEYLQWVVNVQPNTSPGYLMRIMRQQTSEKIFADFTRLIKENPSGDFWAPGYLIMGGTEPHPPQLVRDYIRQTRHRQGQEGVSSTPRGKQ